MNIVIIEDEPAIADNLEFLLKDIEPALKVVKKIASVKDAILWFHKPSEEFDLVFTDIRLTDGLSFEIFEVIKPTKPVVFVTAYDDFALKAFSANAIDYILKPFDKEDLKKALEKFKSFSTPETTADSFDQLLEYFKKEQPVSYKQSYLVHHRTQLVPLKVADVHWFYTEDEIVYAKTGTGKTYTIDATLEVSELGIISISILSSMVTSSIIFLISGHSIFEGLISHSFIGKKNVIRNKVKKYITLRLILLI